MLTITQSQSIKKILLKPVSSIFIIPYAETYQRVCSLWKIYITNPKSMQTFFANNITLQNAFSFHKETNIDHIILYYSYGSEQCLLLCKCGGQYINTLIPEMTLKKHQKSFIATYY